MYIALSFDDGRKDNYDFALPILEKYKLVATFNIATAYVDGSISKEDIPCLNPAMSISNVQSLYKKGHEIACHGDSHKNDIDDIRRGYYKLSKWLEWNEGYKPGFASPNSKMSIDDINSRLNEYKKGFSYMRISSYKKDMLVTRFIRKIAYISGNCNLYNIAYSNNIGALKDGFIAVSVPIMHKVTMEQVKSIIVYAKQQNKDCILMFHSILPKGEDFYEDTWSWDAVKFDELCSWLKEMQDNHVFDVVKTYEIL